MIGYFEGLPVALEEVGAGRRCHDLAGVPLRRGAAGAAGHHGGDHPVVHLQLEQLHLWRGAGRPHHADAAGRGLQRADLRTDLLGTAGGRGAGGDRAGAAADAVHAEGNRCRPDRGRGQGAEHERERCFLGVDVGSGQRARRGVRPQPATSLPIASGRSSSSIRVPMCSSNRRPTSGSRLCAAVREVVAGAASRAKRSAASASTPPVPWSPSVPMATPVSVAEDGDPRRDIIMWMDHRAVAEAAEINATHDPGARLCRRRGQRRDGVAEGAVAAPAFPGTPRRRAALFRSGGLSWCGAPPAPTSPVSAR